MRRVGCYERCYEGAARLSVTSSPRRRCRVISCEYARECVCVCVCVRVCGFVCVYLCVSVYEYVSVPAPDYRRSKLALGLCLCKRVGVCVCGGYY